MLAVVPAAQAAVTPEQAKTLPVAELARLVLGEAGANVVDVDRPAWPVCGPVCGPAGEEERRTAPPLVFGMTFYQRPSALFGTWPPRWRGLCESEAILVFFDEEGSLTGISSQKRYGVPRGLVRAEPPPPGQEGVRIAYAQASAACRDHAAPRSFFFAHGNRDSAYHVAVALHLFAEAARRPGPLPFPFDCETFGQDCSVQGRRDGAMESLEFARVSAVWQVDCREPRDFAQSTGPVACYRLDLRGWGDSAFVEIGQDEGEVTIRRLIFRHVMPMI